MNLLLLAVGGGVFVLLLRGLYNQAALRRQWEFVLEPWGSDALENYGVKAASEAAMFSSTYRRAQRARVNGSHDEALRILDVGLRLVDRTAVEWIDVLRAVALVSRMANAITPLSPMVPWAFRTPTLSGLALVGSVLSYLLVTTGERLRLRAYVLRSGWRIVRRRLAESTSRIRARGLDDERGWTWLEAARADLAVVSSETLRSFHAVLVSMSAKPSPAAMAGAARRS